MKRALHLFNEYRFGGSQNVALNYSIVLNKLGVAPCVSAADFSAEYKDYIQQYAITVDNNNIGEEIKKVDYIFVHSNKSLVRLISYLPIIKSKKIKVIYIQHLNYSRKKFRILSKLINFVCTDFIQITPITTKVVNRYIKINKHLIINFSLTEHAEIEREAINNRIRTELNIGQRKMVLFTGRFFPGKGVSEFLELAAHFKDNSDHIFVIVGDGLESHLVKEYPHNNLIWTGFVSNVDEYLIASDIYCFPSKYAQEMMPMTVIEAINNKKKVISFSTEINNFLLPVTFSNVEEMAKEIVSGEYSITPYCKYGEEYALAKMKELLDL